MGLEKINEYRKNKGLSLEELSIKSGVPIGTLSKINAGITKNPNLETVKAIALALECSLDDFDDNVTKKISNEAMEIAQAYDKAELKTQNIVRMTLDLPLKEEKKVVELKPKEEKEKIKEHLIVNAAHAIEGASEEDIKHDDDIMDDPDF